MPENGMKIDALRILRKIPGGAQTFFRRLAMAPAVPGETGPAGIPAFAASAFPRGDAIAGTRPAPPVFALSLFPFSLLLRHAKASRPMKSAPDSPAPTARRGTVAIVASRYNARFTDALVESASATLAKLAPDLAVRVVRVPGAFEIPVVVEALACSEDQPLAILALGVIIRGSTAHADLIAESITRSLQDTGVSHLLPVIHEVLLVENAAQAETRTLGDELNRGREAAEAAVAMIEVMASLE